MSLVDSTGGTPAAEGQDDQNATPPAGETPKEALVGTDGKTVDGETPKDDGKATKDDPWFYDDGKPGEGARPDWLSPKYKTAAEQAKAYNEAQKKLGAFKGAPDDYDLTLPDYPDAKFEKEDPYIAEFLEDAKKNNVSQEYVSHLLNTYVKMQIASRPDPDKEIEKLGVNAKHDIQILAQWADNVFTKEEALLFKNMMTTADSVRLFEKMRGIMTQADTKPGNPNTPRETEEQVRKMIHDERFETDESFRTMVREKLKAFGS